MSLEKNFESIAKSLEKIATALESRASADPLTNGVSGGTTAAAPVVQAAVAAAPVQAAAAPQVALVAAAPAVQAAAASFDSPVVAAVAPVAQVTAAPVIDTPEKLNELLVIEFNRLGAIHGEAARAMIVNKINEIGGSTSVQGIATAKYPEVLAAVKALV